MPTVSSTLAPINPADTPRRIDYPVLSAAEVLAFLRCEKQYVQRQTIGAMNRIQGDENPHAQAAAEFGTLTHQLFAKMVDRPQESVTRHLQEMGSAFLLHRPKLLRVGHDFRESDLYSHIIQAKHLTEHPFAFSAGNLTVTGRVDLMYSDGEKWQLVDYKTDIAPDLDQGPPPQYVAQMTLYLLAMRHVLNLQQESYAASIYYSSINEIKNIILTNEELDRYAARLSEIPNRLNQRLFQKPDIAVCQACSYYQWDSNCPSKGM